VGFLMVYIIIPYMAAPLQKLFELGIQHAALQ